MSNYTVKLSTTVETFKDLSLGTIFELVGFENPWLWFKTSESEARLVSSSISEPMAADALVRAGIVLRGTP